MTKKPKLPNIKLLSESRTIIWTIVCNTRIVNSNISSYGLILGVQILAYILLLYCTICSHSIHGATIVSWQMQVLIEEMHFLDCCTEVSKLGKHGQRYQIKSNLPKQPVIQTKCRGSARWTFYKFRA